MYEVMIVEDRKLYKRGGIMGLIKAAIGAIGSTLADQWKEFIYCDSMENDVLLQKGMCRVSERSSNTRRDTNVISDGSVIAVNEGQFMLVVEDGAIVDFSATPGEYTYSTEVEPSLFGNEGFDFKGMIDEIIERFKFGGQPGKDQRVYYINTKEILDQKIGIGNVPFRDGEFDFTMTMRGFGTYSFRIVNPLLFYKNVCGNSRSEYRLKELAAQMKVELQREILPVFATLSDKKIPYDKIIAHVDEMCELLKENLTVEWNETRGIELCTVAFSSIAPTAEYAKKISLMQESRVYKDVGLLGARLGAAQANAMEDAANNPAGAVTGFMGMNAAGSNSTAQLLNTIHNVNETVTTQPNATDKKIWVCECGAENTTKFCGDCGKQKPSLEWICSSCGTTNTTKFCGECGQPRGQ